MNPSQVQLFAAVGSPADELLSGTGLALDNEGEQQGTVHEERSLPATSPVFHAT